MAEVPPEAVPPLMAQCAALQSALAARLASVPPNGNGKAEAAGQDRLLTVPEVADLLRVPKGHVYELTRTGKMPAVRFGRHIRVAPADLGEWLAQHKKGLDMGLCVTHSERREGFRGSAHSEAARAYTSRVGGAGRRHRQQRGSMGAGGAGHPGIGSPADPVARRPKGPQA